MVRWLPSQHAQGVRSQKAEGRREPAHRTIDQLQAIRCKPGPLGRRRRRGDDDQPCSRARARPGARQLLWRDQRDGRLLRRLPHPQSDARSLRRRHDERRVHSDVHTPADHRGPRRSLAAGHTVDQRVDRHHRKPGASRCRVCRTVDPAVRRGFQRGTRQARTDNQDDARDAPVSDHGRGRSRLHGDAQLATPVFRAGAVTGDVQRQPHPERLRAGATDAASRFRTDHGDRVCRGVGRCGPDRRPVLGATTGGIPVSGPTEPGRPRPQGDPGTDGPRHDRRRSDAGQPARQHDPGHRSGHRGSLVAHLRVPADVSANRRVGRLDRDRRAAGVVPTCRAR